MKLRVVVCFLCMVVAGSSVMAQRGAVVRGVVSDELGGVIVGATVSLVDQHSKEQTAVTDASGAFSLSGIAAGTYTLKVTQPGFAEFQQANIILTTVQVRSINVMLRVAVVESQVNVDPGATVNTDPNSNKSALSLKGNDLNALSDDPNELAAELSALAGPAAGPSGATVFVDGFTAGPSLPDKQSIREIVINQNPFSAEWERIGFGNIQILTRPGTGQFHGNGAFTFSDAAFNSRNPYAANRPGYQRRIYDAGINGPLSKRSSFFLALSRREIDDTAVVNATALNSSLQPVQISEAIVTPRRLMFISPRFDFQLNQTNTLSTRYSYNSSDLENQGVGGFSLASRGFRYEDHLHILQVIETAVINPRVANEAAFQYIWYGIQQSTNDPGAGLIVLDSFSGGGSQIGNYVFDRNEGELRDYMTMSLGRHSLKFGARLRWARINDIAPTNFGGTFTFSGGPGPRLDAANNIIPGTVEDLSSLERYRRTLLFQQLGFSPAAIRLRGGGASQLTIANGGAFAEVRQWDLAPFIQDDWKLRPNFTLSLGLRYQVQTNINSRNLFAPRVSFAWTPWARGNGTPKTVVRGGAGVFYDLIRTNITLQANRFNGSNQTQYVVDDPLLLDLFPNVPSDAALATLNQPQTMWIKDNGLTEPYFIQSSLSVERSLPRNVTLSLSYVNTRGLHQIRARNINAPLALNQRPFATNDNIYQYETSGVYKQQLFVVASTIRLNPRFSLNANYTLGKAEGDTDGPGSFPAETYNLATEFGRASTDIRHRFTLAGNIDTRWGLSFAPLIVALGGAPFNIITGADRNNDSIFADRPAFATDLSRSSVVQTSFGAFDLAPLPNARIIPRNFGRGPGYFSVNLRVSKTINFGSLPKPVPGQRAPETRPYRLTFSVAAANLFNHTNAGSPIGNLTSPLFGISNSLAQFVPLGTGGSASTSNRSLALRAQFSF
ncbi:MAG TPA: carboxypeptidase regulatory-like domain-containing protein [Pyrinomonadaceae bacterium]|nr:carboxypeptidase regulatory-like domain-containing protein [Pyrinomonadaceae bacterium]